VRSVTRYSVGSNQVRSPRASGPPTPLPIEMLPRTTKNYTNEIQIFRLNLAEISLNCIMLIPNLQNSFPPPTPLNFRCWWPEVAWFGRNVFFKVIMTTSN